MAKPTLVLIHGLVGSLSYFRPEQRVKRARVSAWALLGYGDLRGVPADRLTLANQAEYVADCIRDHTDAPVWVLGHSMGGAVAMLLAERFGELVAGIINVEGNFTLKDAFWSTRIVATPPAEWEAQYRAMAADVPAWVVKCGVEPTPTRVEWAREILAWQPARTVYAMARAILNETDDPRYLESVRRVMDRGVPIHLIAGEKSAAAWGVPDFVRAAARSYTEMPRLGHLMMLEAPDEFCRVVDACGP